MVKTIKLIGILEYMDAIEEVMSVEEYIEKATEKGYKVGVERMPGKHNDNDEDLQRNRLQERGAIK